MTSGPKQTSELVTAAVLARWLGVTPKTVRELAKRGVVVKAGRGLYVLEDSVRNVIADMRKTASARGDEKSLASIRDEKIRLTRAQAQHAELRNAQLRGELVEAAAVEAEWSSVLRTVRATMLAIPSRAAHRLPHLTPHDLAEIDRQIRDALVEIADGNGR